jgi:hypothetical protein
MFKQPISKPIFDFVLEQLDLGRKTIPEVGAGSGVPCNTIYKIKQRRVQNPGVLTIQKLADYFRKI